MPFAGSPVERRLTGFLPIFKKSDVRLVDIIDSIRLVLNFELGINFQADCMKLNYTPRLRKSDAGIVSVCFGMKHRKSLSLLKKAERHYRIFAELGHRSQILTNITERWKPFGKHSSSFETFAKPAHPFTDSITCNDIQAALKSHMGERIQFRFPLEPVIREQVTAMNDKPDKVIRDAFYEGTQPRLVNLISIKNFSCHLPHFEFEAVTCGNLCVHRFVDEVGIQLGTFARINQLILENIDDVITADDCLHQHQLYSQEIMDSLNRYHRKYAAIIKKCDDGSNRSNKHVSPW